MDKTQAEVVANALLQPARQAQEEERLAKAERERKVARQRLIARFAILGVVIGSLIGYFMHKNVLAFLGSGGAVGVVVGALVASWPRKASRAS